VRTWITLCVLALATTSSAQELVSDGEDSDDPLGTGGTESLATVPEIVRAEPDTSHLGPEPPGVEAQDGDVLTAIPGVRESGHATHVRIEDGLAYVEEEMRFVSSARWDAEVRYRLPVPADAAASGVEVCLGERCRQSAHDPSDAFDDVLRARPASESEPRSPIARLQTEDDALLLSAAPVVRDETLVVKVRYVAPAPVFGGVVRFVLPARGHDMRVARSEVTFETNLLAPTLQGAPTSDSALILDAWVPTQLGATLRSGGVDGTATSFPCGDARCARFRIVAGPRSGRASEVVLALDASPSTQGPARGAMARAFATLLSSMPSGSRVRVAAFAGRAEILVAEPREPFDVPATSISSALDRELGATTRIEALFAALGDLPRGTHVILLGDGGLTESDAQLASARRAERRGVRLSVLNLAGRPTLRPLREMVTRLGGANLELPPDLEGRALEERLAPVFMPVVADRVRVRSADGWVDLGELRAGEERTWIGRVDRRSELRAADLRVRVGHDEAPLLAGLGLRQSGQPLDFSAIAGDARATASDTCHPRGPSRRPGGLSTDASPIALATPRTCEPPEPTPPPRRLGRGMPAESVLRLLRQRLIPSARACFRRDRAGRADYSVHARYELTLADREVVRAEVRGEITDVLRACLTDAVDTLDVPRFEGAIVLRYPLYTERAPRPPTIELHDDVAAAIDSVAGDEDPDADPLGH